MSRIIAVDFDGTLQDEYYPHLGNPNTKLINWLIKERNNGAEVVLWTCREGKELIDAIRFCDGYGLVFDSVNTNPKSVDFVSRKVVADLYIDDRAMNVNHPYAPWML